MRKHMPSHIFVRRGCGTRPYPRTCGVPGGYGCTCAPPKRRARARKKPARAGLCRVRLSPSGAATRRRGGPSPGANRSAWCSPGTRSWRNTTGRRWPPGSRSSSVTGRGRVVPRPTAGGQRRVGRSSVSLPARSARPRSGNAARAYRHRGARRHRSLPGSPQEPYWARIAEIRRDAAKAWVLFASGTRWADSRSRPPRRTART